MPLLFAVVFILQMLSIRVVAQNTETFQYPIDHTCDTMHAQVICDPYRWMENVYSAQTQKWLSYEEDKWKKFRTTMYKSFSSAHNDILAFSNSKSHIPIKDGKYYFKYFYRHELTNVELFMGEEVDFDANFPIFSGGLVSEKDRIELRKFKVSNDSKYVAVCFSRNGSDKTEIMIVNANTRNLMKDHIYNVMYSDIVWVNDGFYYTQYNVVSTFNAVSNPKILYHKIGTDSKDDVLIFTRDKYPHRYFEFQLATDDTTLILKEIDEQAGFYNLYTIKLNQLKPSIKLLMNKTPAEQEIEVYDFRNDNIIALTRYLAPNGALIAININDINNWQQIGNDYNDAILMNAELVRDTILVVQYRMNTMADLFVKMTTKGEVLTHTNLTQGLTCNELIKLDDNNIAVIAGFPALPQTSYNLNIDTFNLRILEKSEVYYFVSDISFKVDFYEYEGTKTPLLIIHKKEIKLNGNNPTLLEAYGGFGNYTNHYFDPGVVHFIMQGGVYAYAYTRGNGDLGKEAELAGKRLNKPKVINDFIKAAEFLIQKKYTSPNKLAINGASHGGLLVAAAMVKRPDLFKLVVAEVGIYDMLRFEKFTVGGFHIDEFGTVNNREDFKNLLSYSPYHNIKDNVNYPNMLIICAENDDRTTPFQSYKFVARMQQNPAQKNEILMKLVKKAGHYGANRYYDIMDDMGDKYGTIMHFLSPP